MASKEVDRRNDLQKLLIKILGSKNVYFQPPESVKMKYPAIVYNWSSEDVRFADNLPYNRQRAYTVTVIDRNPDSEIPDRIAELPFCKLERPYVADNLNHWPYTLYY